MAYSITPKMKVVGSHGLNTALQFSLEALLSLPQRNSMFFINRIVTKKPEMFRHFGRIPLYVVQKKPVCKLVLEILNWKDHLYSKSQSHWHNNRPVFFMLAKLAILAKWLKGLLKFGDIVLHIFLQELGANGTFVCWSFHSLKISTKSHGMHQPNKVVDCVRM